MFAASPTYYKDVVGMAHMKTICEAICSIYGKGNAMDEDGREPVQMEVDEDAYPLDSITDFNTLAELKSPEKEVKLKAA
ncbi:hypothetical protein [Parasitella parasitica]|uniref:Uncharacterized protein n=1 Tax=Parasitella parasitica TaxID=35722 RepID=A0A0B7NQ39_9FUNG|nr:hypothetical protein [Parasitella parasitica]